MSDDVEPANVRFSRLANSQRSYITISCVAVEGTMSENLIKGAFDETTQSIKGEVGDLGYIFQIRSEIIYSRSRIL